MIAGLCSVSLVLSFEHNSRGHRGKGVATHEGLIIGQKRHGIDSWSQEYDSVLPEDTLNFVRTNRICCAMYVL